MRLKPEMDASDSRFLRKKERADENEWRACVTACNYSENPVFIDVEANTGMFSFLVAKNVPKARVISNRAASWN